VMPRGSRLSLLMLILLHSLGVLVAPNPLKKNARSWS
jgi:hypothetical protein